MAKTAKKDKKKFGTKDLADRLEVTPKQVRVWLRSQDLNVGRGKEYKFSEAKLEKLAAKYLKQHS